jgi:hypothetical protein
MFTMKKNLDPPCAAHLYSKTLVNFLVLYSFEIKLLPLA